MTESGQALDTEPGSSIDLLRQARAMLIGCRVCDVYVTNPSDREQAEQQRQVLIQQIAVTLIAAGVMAGEESE